MAEPVIQGDQKKALVGDSARAIGRKSSVWNWLRDHRIYLENMMQEGRDKNEKRSENLWIERLPTCQTW